MKRNALALGVAAALGVMGAAQAQIVQGDATEIAFAPHHMGHVLIPTLFNAANGNFTNVNVVNTDTVNGKLVKVRVRSAVNSDDLYDFQVFMSPGDMWTAVITTDPATGVGSILTRDTSCTLPYDINNGQLHNFKMNRLPLATDVANVKDWTREGYVEILNMADIPGAGTTAYNADTAYSGEDNKELYNGRLFKATKHTAGKPTCDPAVLGTYNTYVTGGTLDDFQKKGLDHPTGGLFANVTLMNGHDNLVFSTEVPALEASLKGEDGVVVSKKANIIFSPQVNNVAVTDIDKWTSDPLFRTKLVSAANFDLPRSASQNGGPIGVPIVNAFANDLPDLSTPYVKMGTLNTGSPLASVAKLMNSIAVTDVYNEFYNNDSYGGRTDWSLTNPFRRYQVAMDYESLRRSDRFNLTGYDGRVFTMPYGVNGVGVPMLIEGVVGTVTAAPWIQYYNPANTSLDNAYAGTRVCVAADGAQQWNREEGATSDGYVVSPSSDNRMRFCGEVTVLGVGQTSVPTSVLGADVTALGMSSPYKEGWMALAVKNTGTVSGVANMGPSFDRGLPVLGQAFMKAVNGGAGAGVTTNYGMSFYHRYEKAKPAPSRRNAS